MQAAGPAKQRATDDYVPFSPGEDGKTSGPFGPIYERFQDRFRNALNFLRREKYGEATRVLTHKDVPGPISLVYGKKGTAAANYEDGYGIAKIDHKHPGALDKLQSEWDSLVKSKKQTDPQNRIVLSNGRSRAVVGIRFQERRKVWLVTACEIEGADATRTVPVRDNQSADGTPPSSAPADIIRAQVQDVKLHAGGHRSQGLLTSFVRSETGRADFAKRRMARRSLL